ncbi:Crp/Fnr family transcriptional regulator [Pulveribacter sp.]|uniref:Crp/Fnr family transcriptional regulator n=1 Tax=Pulveribacter sp. TaxID=2678893 RepID=UPI0028A722B3|nr:Crp/Fnr family transcriptional regulator [Pulveribacter sp.]
MPDTPSPPARSSLALRRVRLLQGLDPDRLAELAQQCRWYRLEARQTLVTDAEGPSDVYFILGGRVRIATYAVRGREVTLRDCGTGAHFGSLSALDGEPRPADVVALEPTLLASLQAAQFVALLHREPLVAQRMVRYLIAAVRELAGRVVELSTLAVQSRLHSELLRLAQEAGVQDNAALIAPAPLHAELASRIGTSREQVTRELSALVRRGLLRRDGRRGLVLPDVAALQALVVSARDA